MGKITNLAIDFDNNLDVFSPNDIIRGRLVLDIEAHTEQGLENVKGRPK